MVGSCAGAIAGKRQICIQGPTQWLPCVLLFFYPSPTAKIGIEEAIAAKSVLSPLPQFKDTFIHSNCGTGLEMEGYYLSSNLRLPGVQGP